AAAPPACGSLRSVPRLRRGLLAPDRPTGRPRRPGPVRAPGATTRPRRDEDDEFVSADPPLTLDQIVGPDEGAVTLAETIVAHANGEDQVLGTLGAQALLDLLPPEAPVWLREALALIAAGDTISESAAGVGQSRFAVRRAINSWALAQATAMHPIRARRARHMRS